MIRECVLHVGAAHGPNGSGWGFVLRGPAGEVLGRGSGGEASASAYLMQLLGLLRGLGSLPGGTSRVVARIADQALLSRCTSYARDGRWPRKALCQDLLVELARLLATREVVWINATREARQDGDQEAKALARDAAVVSAPSSVGDAPAQADDETEPDLFGGTVDVDGGVAEAPLVAIEPPTVVAFTDGGCRPNPGPGGWGFLLVHAATQAALERRGGERDTTNNRMEMLAAIRALEAVKGRGERVEVRSDSQYLVEMCSRWIAAWKARGWKRKGKEPILNLDLVQRLDALMAVHDVCWTWVRGHAGDPGNEHADRLANAAMDCAARGEDPRAERRYAPGMSPVRVALPEPAGLALRMPMRS